MKVGRYIDQNNSELFTRSLTFVLCIVCIDIIIACNYLRGLRFKRDSDFCQKFGDIDYT